MIDLDGMPQFDREEPSASERARARRAERLRRADFRSFPVVKRPLSLSIDGKIQEIRRAYRAELERLSLLVYRPGLQRAYVQGDDREYLLDAAGRKLAAIWVQHPDPGEFILVIRSEVYAWAGSEAVGHGFDGSA